MHCKKTMWNLTKCALFTKFSSSKRKISNSLLPILTTSSWLFALLPLKSFYWRVDEKEEKEIMELCFVLLAPGSLSSPDGILFGRNQWVRRDLFPVQALVRYSITQAPTGKRKPNSQALCWVELNSWDEFFCCPNPVNCPVTLLCRKRRTVMGVLLAGSQKLLYN